MNIARRLGWVAGLIAAGCSSGVAIEPPDPACPAIIQLHGSCEPRKASCTVQEGPCSVSYGCGLADNFWAVESTVCTPAAEGGCSDGAVCETPGDKCANDTAIPCGNFAYCEDDHYWHLPTCDPPEPDSCPGSPPAEGSPCSIWNDPPVCEYGFVCGEVSSASCDPEGVWHLTIIDCPPPESCAAHAEAECGADPACRWLVPGCGDPALPAAGCFALDDCAPDTCAAGLVCQKAVYDPCYLAGCAACGADALLCLP